MFADVALAVPLYFPLTYIVPNEMNLQIGMRVVVPFRRKEIVGVILNIHNEEPANMKLKEVKSVCDNEIVLSANLIKLCKWISEYYLAPIGEVCRAALPSPFFRADKLPNSPRIKDAHIVESFGAPKTIQLTDAQQSAGYKIYSALEENKFKTFLLHGVTGSGKTEVYLNAIEKTLSQGRQALLLLPEIGLTPQLLSRVGERFGERIAVYHSGLTDAQRTEQWMRMRSGEALVCCGTRSAVFSPFSNLGCIILDEEHDNAYKQEESPRYHGRDVAIVRAKHCGAIAILGSATPSLESFHNVDQGKYEYLHLPERPGESKLPTIEIIDMRDQPDSNDISGLLSEPLRNAIAHSLAQKEQVMLFLNRRGFANLLLCRKCSYVFACPNCDIALTLHKKDCALRCHYCEYQIKRPKECSECESDYLKAVGSGTERIEDALHSHFPEVNIARMDKDTTTARNSRENTLKKMRNGQIDILIGTQMITKGHDFPNVTLVGVVQADTSLHMPDFRSSEKTFQIITQVSGRAGRSENPGKVIIQTYTPEHYSLLYAQQHNYEAFRKEECSHRQSLGYPPFGRLVNIRFSGNIENKVSSYAENLRDNLQRINQGGTNMLGILGPTPATHAKIAGKHRWHLLIKAGNAAQVRKVSNYIREHITTHAPKGVQVAIDVDPVNLV